MENNDKKITYEDIYSLIKRDLGYEDYFKLGLKLFNQVCVFKAVNIGMSETEMIYDACLLINDLFKGTLEPTKKIIESELSKIKKE